MKGMRGNSLIAVMAAAMFGQSPYKTSKKQMSVVKGEYQRYKGKRDLNQRQKRKLVRQNPHLRHKIL